MPEQVTYDPETDILYVKLDDGDVAETKALDDLRLVDYGEDRRTVVGIEFLDASQGIDLDDVPLGGIVERLIGESGLSQRVFA